MNKLLKSKLATVILLALIVLLIVFTFRLRTAWWMFCDIFFLFMMAFSHMMALSVQKISIPSAKKLDSAAMIFGILFVVALIAEFIIWQVIF